MSTLVSPGLVLARKEGQILEITTPTGEIVYVSVINIGRGTTRIGVKTPPGWNVARGEQKGLELAPPQRKE